MLKFFASLFITAALMTSCQDLRFKKQSYYKNGNTNECYTVDYRGRKQGAYKSYYEDGNLFDSKFYINDTLSQYYLEYHKNKKLSYKSYFWKGVEVGESFTFNRTGKTRVYTEFDYEGKCYYVIKYDTLGKLIMEEGVGCSPNGIILKDSTGIFFYANPPNYRSEIKIYYKDEVIPHTLETIPHIGKINLKGKETDIIYVLAKVYDEQNNLIINDSTKLVFKTLEWIKAEQMIKQLEKKVQEGLKH